MKKLKTEDEVTKRLLLVVHYMNQQPNLREITVDANTYRCSYFWSVLIININLSV